MSALWKTFDPASAVVPVGIVLLLAYAMYKRVAVFSAFTEGAAGALSLLKTVLPSLAAMLLVLSVLEDSGLLDAVTRLLSPLLMRLGVDARLLPLLVVRPLSGSAAVAALTELFKKYGPDSPVGMTGSVLLGASETLFYTLGLYFGTVGVRKTRFTVPLAVTATLVSVVSGLLFSRLFFG